MALPVWAVGLIIKAVTPLIKLAIEALRHKVDDTPNTIDNKLVDIVDIVIDHKVKQKDTTVDALLQKEIKRAISRIKT